MMNIKKEWKLKNSIVDIGTGIDFRYLKIFAPILQSQGLSYYAIERDADALARIKAGLKNRNLEDTVEVFESIDEFIVYKNTFLGDQKFDVICTEVLEHNEFNEAQAIIKKIYKEIAYDKFIMTVPNSTFNQFYGIDGFRHDDHKFEPNWDETVDMFKNYNSKLYNVGDVVNNIPVTIGICIS